MKTITGINSILYTPNEPIDVNVSYIDEQKIEGVQDILVPFNSVDLTALENLIVDRAETTIPSIVNFMYQKANDTLQLNRRFIVNIDGSPLSVFLNIEAQYKEIDNKNQLVSARNFTTEEVGTLDEKGNPIILGIINGAGIALITYAQSVINGSQGLQGPQGTAGINGTQGTQGTAGINN